VAVRPTSVRMLLLVAALAGVAGWVFADWVDDRGRLPAVPWLAVVMIWVVAGFVGAWAVVARRRLRPEPGGIRMAPLVAARTAALALAGSRTGALLLGGYGGLALRLAQETAVAAGRERLLASALAAVGGLVLAGLSLWLERICRLPEDPDEVAGTEPDRRPGAAGTADGAHA
jgi:hypothetical protein